MSEHPMRKAFVVERDAVTGVPTFRCLWDECDRTYAQVQNVLRHIDSKHLGSLYYCPACNGVYESLSAMTKHLTGCVLNAQRKGGGRCPHCPERKFVFKTMETLKGHISYRHPEKHREAIEHWKQTLAQRRQKMQRKSRKGAPAASTGVAGMRQVATPVASAAPPQASTSRSLPFAALPPPASAFYLPPFPTFSLLVAAPHMLRLPLHAHIPPSIPLPPLVPQPPTAVQRPPASADASMADFDAVYEEFLRDKPVLESLSNSLHAAYPEFSSFTPGWEPLVSPSHPGSWLSHASTPLTPALSWSDGPSPASTSALLTPPANDAALLAPAPQEDCEVSALGVDLFGDDVFNAYPGRSWDSFTNA